MASPNAAKAAALQQRLTTHARRWPQITEIKVRWRAGYAYIDAALDNDEGGLQLCRLKDTGHPELWGFALFTYSNERYEDNVLPTGLPFGKATVSTQAAKPHSCWKTTRSGVGAPAARYSAAKVSAAPANAAPGGRVRRGTAPGTRADAR